MPSSRLGFGLALSLALHLALLAMPAAIFSGLLTPQDSAPASTEIEARLRPLAKPPLAPAVAPRKRARRAASPRPVLSALSAPSLAEVLAPPPSPPEAMASPDRQTPETVPAATPTPVVEPQATPTGVPLPPAGRIQFAVNRGDKGFVIGRAVHRWRHDGARYEISNTTETTGLAALFRPVTMVQTSSGAVVGTTLQPREYRSERDGKVVDAASFDWATLRLSYGSGRSATLTTGAQDMLSAFYQLGRQAIEGGMELALTTGKKYESYRFVVLGEETLNLRFGEVRTIHLKSGGAAGSDATEVWLAPALFGLPLKIRYTDRNGDAYDQLAEEIEFEDQTNAGADKR